MRAGFDEWHGTSPVTDCVVTWTRRRAPDARSDLHGPTGIEPPAGHRRGGATALGPPKGGSLPLVRPTRWPGPHWPPRYSPLRAGAICRRDRGQRRCQRRGPAPGPACCARRVRPSCDARQVTRTGCSRTAARAVTRRPAVIDPVRGRVGRRRQATSSPVASHCAIERLLRAAVADVSRSVLKRSMSATESACPRRPWSTARLAPRYQRGREASCRRAGPGRARAERRPWD